MVEFRCPKCGSVQFQLIIDKTEIADTETGETWTEHEEVKTAFCRECGYELTKEEVNRVLDIVRW